MHDLALDDAALKAIYETTPARFLLLDADGNLPNRTQNWPPATLAGLPPTVDEVVPLKPGETPWTTLGDFKWKDRTL